MLNNERKLILTTHARARALQFRITVPKLCWMFWHSEEEGSPPGSEKYQIAGENEMVFYLRSGTIVMTAKEITDRYTQKPAYLLITLFDQQMYLSTDHLQIADSVPMVV